MANEESGKAEGWIKNERRGVWLALIVVLALAVTMLFDPDTRRALLTSWGIGIVAAVAWLGSRRSRSTRQTREAVLHDELRKTAIDRACKGSFFTVLGALAAFCVLSTLVTFGAFGSMATLSVSGVMVAPLALVLAVTVFLALFLLFDRG